MTHTPTHAREIEHLCEFLSICVFVGVTNFSAQFFSITKEEGKKWFKKFTKTIYKKNHIRKEKGNQYYLSDLIEIYTIRIYSGNQYYLSDLIEIYTIRIYSVPEGREDLSCEKQLEILESYAIYNLK